MDSSKFTGIVLAGGKSSRMDREKGLIAWNGKTLVENAIEILSALCDEIIISANNSRYNTFAYPVIQDEYMDCGPLGGILTCLTHSDSELNLIIPVDVPYVNPGIYDQLTKQGDNYDIIVPIDHKSYYQPLCAVFNKSVIKIMKEQIRIGTLGFTPLIQKVNSCEVSFQLGDQYYNEKTFLNINSPDDLKDL